MRIKEIDKPSINNTIEPIHPFSWASKCHPARLKAIEAFNTKSIEKKIYSDYINDLRRIDAAPLEEKFSVAAEMERKYKSNKRKQQYLRYLYKAIPIIAVVCITTTLCYHYFF